MTLFNSSKFKVIGNFWNKWVSISNKSHHILVNKKYSETCSFVIEYKFSTNSVEYFNEKAFKIARSFSRSRLMPLVRSLTLNNTSDLLRNIFLKVRGVYLDSEALFSKGFFGTANFCPPPPMLSSIMLNFSSLSL